MENQIMSCVNPHRLGEIAFWAVIGPPRKFSFLFLLVLPYLSSDLFGPIQIDPWFRMSTLCAYGFTSYFLYEFKQLNQSRIGGDVGKNILL